MSSQRTIQFSTEPHQVFYLCPTDHKAEVKAAKMVCLLRLWPKNTDMPPPAEEKCDDKENGIDSDNEADEAMSIEALGASLRRRKKRARRIAHAVSKVNRNKQSSFGVTATADA